MLEKVYKEPEQQRKELYLKNRAAKDFYQAYRERSPNLLDFSEDSYPFVDESPPKIYQKGHALYISTDPLFLTAV